MITRKPLFYLMLVITIVFILYVVYINFIHDPQASEFLSHKLNLERQPANLPIWINVLHFHIIFACIATFSGAINFANGVKHKYRKLHRINGYVYLIAVTLVVITSGYMAPYTNGGKINSMAFNILNIIWLAITITALVKIKKKQINKHQQWMVRSYAYCFTNMLITILTFVLHNGFGLLYETSYTIGIYSTIPLLFIIAEIVNGAFYKSPIKAIVI
jgi:hypothetical protein